MDQPRAKVFISCGQNDSERKVAAKLSKALEKLGYQPYVATQQQTLKGLKENIFKELSSSEYFIFIDFKREKLEGQKDCRGSLFSHQELSIASFREMPVIAFQEEGVIKLDGIMKYIQANCDTFSDRRTLVKKVLRKIKNSNWRANWKNQLRVEAGDFSFAKDHSYPVIVKNLHSNKPATNCLTFLAGYKYLSTNQEVKLGNFQLGWSGCSPEADMSVLILPSSHRSFEAFRFDPPKISIQTYDYNIWPELLGVSSVESRRYPGRSGKKIEFKPNCRVRLEYLILSDNFDPVRATFKLKLSENIENIKFELLQSGTLNSEP